ncbi:MAG: leucyl aminopeptidase [Syntrophobacteraceae bacterium]
MQIEWHIAPISEWRADAILFFAFENAPEPLPGFRHWISEGSSWPGDAAAAALADFQWKPQQVALFYAPQGGEIPRVICTGLGPEDKFDMDKLRGAVSAAVRKCRELRLASPALPLQALEGLPVETGAALREGLMAAFSSLYHYDALKTRDTEHGEFPETLVLLAEKEPGEALREISSLAAASSMGLFLARELTILPANEATPSYLAEVAGRLSEQYDFRLEVFDLEKARSMGMGAFAAVAQGSREPARMIVLEHVPPGTGQDPPLVFIGKGITFDTGGISLKPSANLEAMKQDMAGAAAVLGAMDAIGTTGLNRRVVAILPCTENMPGGEAYKPGDVLRSLSGQTIEVISTDAEGRLILCDAITYAQSFQPALIVDIATLTGACVTALGTRVAGLMGNRDALIQKVRELGMEIGERLWPLPLFDFYFDQLKSDVADFKNVGDRTAGSIVAGMFLKQFVPDGVPWLHLDIAGTAWADKDTAATPKGATGFGARLLLELARRWPELATEA